MNLADFQAIYPTLTRRHLMALGGRKNHGLGFGFDAERNPETQGTENLRAYMLRRWAWDGLLAAWNARPQHCTCIVCTYNIPAAVKSTPTPTTTTKETPMPTTTTGDAATNLAAAIAAIAAQSIDEATVRRIVDEAIAANTKVTERVVYRNRDNGFRKPGAEGDYVHPDSEEIIMNMMNGIHTLLVGPAGTGKTTLAEQCARSIGWSPLTIGCAGSSPVTFSGNWLPSGENGQFIFHLSDFAKGCEQGETAIILDEFDRVNPSDALVLNDVLASGKYRIPGYGEVRLAETTGIVATANTFGSGADPMYVSEMLDASTLSRFDCAVIHIDYDRDLEQRLGSKALLDWAWKVREVIDAAGMRRTMSTRTIVKAQAMLDMGRSMDTIKTRYFAAWSRTERSKVGYTGK